jgi:hypothetical protein
MPAKPLFIERLRTITQRLWSTSGIGMSWIGELGSVRAAGFVTALAPITSATSMRGNSPLIS